jgi:hypothetical protein
LTQQVRPFNPGDYPMKLFPLLLVALLMSCSAPEVLQLSANTYIVEKSSKAGVFTDMGHLRAECIRAANEYAAAHGKVAVAVSAQWDRPAMGFPSYEYQFALVDPSDPRARDVSLVPTPQPPSTTVIAPTTVVITH